MKTFILILSVLLSGAAHADNGGAIFINASDTEAKLLLNEVMVDGELSRFFDQMKVEETGTDTRKSKSFQMSNGRFLFVCSKGTFIGSPPATSCTFTIKAGDDSSDINAFISKDSSGKIASLAMTQVFAQELGRIFPSDSEGTIHFLLKTTNGVTLEVTGATWGNLTIGFSGT